MIDPFEPCIRSILSDTPNATSSPVSESGSTRSGSPDGPMIDPFGPAHAPVNRSRRRANEGGSRTRGTFGRNFLDLSNPIGLSQYLASRLLAKTDLLGSTLFTLTWKVRTTPAGRSICALRASGRRTSDSGCGSWPTPMAGTPAQKGYNEAGNTDSSRKTVDLIGWNTPRATDGSNGGPNQAGGALPADAAKAFWSTPRANKWGFPDTHGSDEAPIASWATPTTRDHKDGDCSEQLAAGTVPINALLGRQVQLTASGGTPTGSPAATVKRGQLNPAHSRWLMGLPTVWDDCAPTATRSMPKRRKSS
jgi:hypothetical protein